MGDSEHCTINNPHYWNHTIEILPKLHYWESYVVLFCTIGGKVEFINLHYREIRTMGGRTTNRGPGVLCIYVHLCDETIQRLCFLSTFHSLEDSILQIIMHSARALLSSSHLEWESNCTISRLTCMFWFAISWYLYYHRCYIFVIYISTSRRSLESSLYSLAFANLLCNCG